MINVKLTIPTELIGSKRFKFHTDSHVDFDVHTVGSISSQYEQRCRVGQVRSAIEALQALACSASVTIQAATGHARVDFDITALDPTSQQTAELGLGDIQPLVEQFVNTYPESTFSLAYTQAVKVTSVQAGPMLN